MDGLVSLRLPGEMTFEHLFVGYRLPRTPASQRLAEPPNI